MRKLLLLVTLLVAPFPFFLKAVAQVPTGPGTGHGFLIDKHIEAGTQLRLLSRRCAPAQCAQDDGVHRLPRQLPADRVQDRHRSAQSACLASGRNSVFSLSSRPPGVGNVLRPMPRFRPDPALTRQDANG